MTVNILFAAKPDRWADYETPLRTAFARAGIDADLRTDFAPEEVDYIIYAPNGPLSDFSPYTRCKAVLSLWAGVEGIITNTTLTQPMARMVDTGLERGMVEWVTGHTLRHHLSIDQHIHGQDGIWRPGHVPPLAADRPVTVLGLGALGRACGLALTSLGFPVTGWSRTQKSIPGIRCLAGDAGLTSALSGAEILILLLPRTPATDNIMTAERFALLGAEACVLNPGRGALIDDAALIAALDAGQLGHATLDVFRVEPLPPAHAFWAHPKITVTPHIASETRPDTASTVIAENIRRGEAGQPFLHLVNRAQGY